MLGRGLRLMLMLLVATAMHSPAAGQEVSYVRKSRFGIPFSIDQQDLPRVREVQLYLSDDQGRSWRIYKVAQPTESEFPFHADRDGHYWFIIRTLSVDGQLQPANLDGRGPDLRVVVDTRPPQVILQALPTQGDLVGVAWEVVDENLVVSSLVLEYRPVGGDWQELDIEKTPTGRKLWQAGGRGDLDVRMRAKDRAENSNTGFTSLRGGRAAAGGVGSSTQGYDSNPGRPVSTGSLPNVLYVNHADIQFRFQLEEVGPSGISSVDLYYTKDGQTWRKYGEDASREPPLRIEDQSDNVKVIKARLPGEGAYGIIMVPRSGVGIGGAPPQRGDRAMLWIEVDERKPSVQLLRAQASRSAEGTLLTFTWTAADKNLDTTPISLFYAEQLVGPWHLIERNLDNTGRFVWRVPPEVPFRFYVRVEARDKANNVGVYDSKEPVVVDLTQPRIKLLGVEPAGGSGSGGGSLSIIPPGG